MLEEEKERKKHSVLDETLNCFKGTFLELLVWDITKWRSLSLGYADQEMYYLGLQDFFICWEWLGLKSFNMWNQMQTLIRKAMALKLLQHGCFDETLNCFHDLYLLRWKLLYILCRVPLASSYTYCIVVFNFYTIGG